MALAQSELGDTASGAGLGTMIMPGLGTGIGAAVGAGVGLADYFGFQKPAQQKALALKAATERYSPWTKAGASAFDPNPAPANPLGTTLGAASSLASLGQNMDRGSAQQNYNNAFLQNLHSGQAASMPAAQPPMGGMAGGTQPYSLYSQSAPSPYSTYFNQYGNQ